MNNLSLKTTSVDKHIKQTPDITVKFSQQEKRKLAEASKGFESMLAQMMIKSMTKTTKGLLGGGSYGGQVFDTLFEGKLAEHMTGNNSFGLAESIYEKVTGEKPNFDELLNKDPQGINSRNEKIELKNLDTKKPTVIPGKNSMNRLQKYDPIVKEAAEKYGVSTNLVKSIILSESAAREDAKSHANAKGLMQLMDSTASDMGVKNIWNPVDNIYGGTKYISKMLNEYDGDIQLALAAYNAGPGNVNKYNGIPPFNETKNYVNRVMGYLNYLEG
jgi:Rod binding domain-containing protein